MSEVGDDAAEWGDFCPHGSCVKSCSAYLQAQCALSIYVCWMDVTVNKYSRLNFAHFVVLAVV